jgi:transposase
VSLRPQPPRAIPEATHCVAHAAFAKGTLCLRIADELAGLYRDDQFAELFPTRGQPAASPARLAWVCVLQYIEGLSDRQAAEAVRGRIDWKYALALELTDPGCNRTVLSEFCSRLVNGQAERRILDTLLDRLSELGLIHERGRQRTDSTHVLTAVRALNRLERVGETMRAALNDLAVPAPEWLRGLAPPEWYRRYDKRVENYHLPKTDAAREELARVIAADGERLLAAVDAATDQPVLAPYFHAGVIRSRVERAAIRGRGCPRRSTGVPRTRPTPVPTRNRIGRERIHSNLSRRHVLLGFGEGRRSHVGTVGSAKVALPCDPAHRGGSCMRRQ